MTKIKELWRTIPDFPLYEVSNTGKVKSLKRNIILKEFKFFKKCRDGTRRPKMCTLSITNNKGSRIFTVHKLVMAAFNKNTDKNLSIDHINRNPFDNNLSNLRWATIKEQSMNSKKATRRKDIKKISYRELNEIYKRSKKETLSSIGKDYHLSKQRLCFLLITMHPKY